MNKPKREKMPGWVTGKGMTQEEWTAATRQFLDDIATGEREYLSIIQLPFPRWCAKGQEISEVEKLVYLDPRLKMVKNYVYRDYEIRRTDDDKLTGADEDRKGSPLSDRES